MTDRRIAPVPPTSTTPGPGLGWLAFAGAMLVLVGAFNVVVGLVALARSEVFVPAPNAAILFSVSGWGWIHLIVGVLLVATGVGVFSGNAVARTAAVLVQGTTAVDSRP